LTTFRASVPLGLERLKIGPVWLSFVPKTYPHYSVRSFYRFAISTAENCFGRILMTFSGPRTTGAVKVDNRVWITQFWQLTYTQTIWDAFLAVFFRMGRNSLGQIFTIVSGSSTIGAWKFESGTQMTQFWT